MPTATAAVINGLGVAGINGLPQQFTNNKSGVYLNMTNNNSNNSSLQQQQESVIYTNISTGAFASSPPFAVTNLFPYSTNLQVD